jgi:hypothetical protein
MDPPVLHVGDGQVVQSIGVIRRLYRGIVFALLIGFVGAGLSIIPGLFVQSIFIGNAQRCEEQQRYDLLVVGEIQTTCGEAQSDTPQWLPVSIIVGGGLFGLVGGFAYGVISPTSGTNGREREQPWLPF